MKHLFLFLLFCLLSHISFSQSRFNGRIFEYKTKIHLGGIRVENLKTHQVSISDTSGVFAIAAAVGDNISFSGFSYRADTLYLTSLKYQEVYMEINSTMLNEVKVVTPEIKTGSLTAPPPVHVFGADNVRYQTDAAGNYIGGVKLLVFEDGYGKKKKRDAKVAGDEEKKQEIASAFTPKSLQSYLPISGQEMDNFIILYTPDVKTYSASGFNMVTYLNACYKKFLTIPVEQRQSKTFLKLDINRQ